MADEPLPEHPILTPKSIEDIELNLLYPGPIASENGETPNAWYNVQVQMNGDIEVRKGELIPHLTGTEISQLLAIMTRLRGKAEVAWIP